MRETNCDKAHHDNLFELLIKNKLTFAAVGEISGRNPNPENKVLYFL